MEPLMWQIHFLSALSPTLLRIVVGIYFVYMARFLYRERSSLMNLSVPVVGRFQPWMVQVSVLFTAAVGIMFIAGLQMPIASLLGICIALKHWYGTRDYAPYLPFSRSTYILLAVLCLSLLVTGPGIFGFDSPLY